MTSEESVREIRRLERMTRMMFLLDGHNGRAVAKHFGVSHQAIYKMAHHGPAPLEVASILFALREACQR